MITLRSHGYEATVLPEIGAMIASLRWRDDRGASHDILLPESGAAPSTQMPNRFGCWAMLPFANRAFDNVVDDGEQRFAVPANAGDGSIHGFGWHSAWTVSDRSEAKVTLEHRRDAGEDPYRYRARQVIALDEAGLTVSVDIVSEADRALPFGLGFHPWFPCGADTTLHLRAGGALDLGEHYRATGHTAFGDGGPYAEPCAFRQANETAWSLTGWGGQALIETPSRGLAVALAAGETLRHPVIWAPAGADFLCVEPQSHAIGAVCLPEARAATPLTRLAAGETLSGWMRLAAVQRQPEP